MRVAPRVLLILLIKLVCLMQNAFANEVIGCGGFLKSHAEIDFSKVEIKLLTKQGVLKDKTDCSPSNGYYFLPIYDKGDYVLSLSPPPGWSFEPDQVELNFDGKTDLCSQGKDVNFVFKGFGITGKVALAGYPGSGARGVDIELHSENGADVRNGQTDVNGVFSFSPIIPGKYVVRAKHAKWHFSKAEHNVVVVSGNTVLPGDALIVGGFDVSGRFEIGGQLTSVGVALFKQKNNQLTPPAACKMQTSVDIRALKTEYDSTFNCYAKVDKNGVYTFENIPPGKYLLQPANENTNLKLHLSPTHLEFEVTKDTLQISEAFKVTGFTIMGKVLSSEAGKPIQSATIKLNGQQVAKTDASGSYTLANVQAGIYAIQVESPQLQFEVQNAKVQITTQELPVIVPAAFEVCGKVISQKSYTVGITKVGSTYHTTTATEAKTGSWCVHLSSGIYHIEVLTTDTDRNSGVQFYPVQQLIEVKDSPISGTTFSQLRAKIRGEINCMPDATSACTEAEVTLQGLDTTGQPNNNKLVTKAYRGKYNFKDVLPGPYEITIPQANLCYESRRVLLNVASTEEEAPVFEHKGYEVSIISSHRANMRYTHNAGAAVKSPTESLKLLEGMNTFCVSKYGSYDFKLESCHLYDDSLPTTFITPEPDQLQALIINAIAHKVGIRVLSTEANADTLKLSVESEALGKQIVTPVVESHKVDGKHAYRYDVYLKPDESLQITPQSDVLLFVPQSKQIVGTKDCVDIAFNFVATRGLILRGKVVPAIKDAKITLTFPENPELTALTTQTSVTGEFKFVPIDENLPYDLIAEKESYIFSDYNVQSASFSAHKLCEIIAEVTDDANKPLSGVLLSLSGAESFRKNLITSNDGIIKFHSLSPSQYFLRPMMKEYKFEPNSKMIDIKDGETVSIKLTGKRYAYSVFGMITSLNGEPFGQVNVEALADEKCQHQQEEATSEASGQYRLRGLQPGCKYTIRAKTGGANANVQRTLPTERTVLVAQEDVHDINLIAISPINIVDVTARVTASQNEYYKTLRVVIYRRGAADSPVFSQRVQSPLNPKSDYNPGIMVYFPRIPLDGKNYIIELQSTLSLKTYTYKTPSEMFVANTSSIFVEFDFRPEVRVVEADINQNSISALVLVALVAIAFFRQDLAMDFLNFICAKVNDIAADIAQRQRNNAKTNTRKSEPINQREIDQMADQINAIKKKKTKKI